MKQTISTENQVQNAKIFYISKHTWKYHIFARGAEATLNLLMNTGFEGFKWVDSQNMQKDDLEKNAEKLFALFNMESNPLNTDIGQTFLRDAKVGHTSMSVGDLIVFDDQKIMVVDNMGFVELDMDDLRQ